MRKAVGEKWRMRGRYTECRPVNTHTHRHARAQTTATTNRRDRIPKCGDRQTQRRLGLCCECRRAASVVSTDSVCGEVADNEQATGEGHRWAGSTLESAFGESPKKNKKKTQNKTKAIRELHQSSIRAQYSSLAAYDCFIVEE